MDEPVFDKDKIIKRITKLLAMADESGNASDNERESAMRMALATAAKYNLSISEIEQQGKGQQEKRGPVNVKIRNRAWVRDCHMAVAHLFFCEYFFTTSRIDHNVAHSYFIGRESNVITASEMAQFVVSNITKEANAQQKARGQTNAWRLNFQKGASYRIMERCRALRREAEQQNQPMSGSTALVLASVYQQEQAANQQYIQKDMGIKLTVKDRRDRNAWGDGATLGYQHGDKVSLNKQVTNSTANRPALK